MTAFPYKCGGCESAVAVSLRGGSGMSTLSTGGRSGQGGQWWTPYRRTADKASAAPRGPDCFVIEQIVVLEQKAVVDMKFWYIQLKSVYLWVMDTKEVPAYEPPCCQIVLLQPGRVLLGSPTGTTKDIDYEDL